MGTLFRCMCACLLVAGCGSGPGGDSGHVDVVSTSSAGGSETAAGGAGGFGGIADGGGGADLSVGGSGGGGVTEPVCPAPRCAQGSSTVNCDPVCGEVHIGCASCTAADTWPTITLPHGTTELRLAPITGMHPACDACETNAPPMWDMRLQLQPDTSCITVDGPADVELAGVGVEPPDRPPLCYESGPRKGCMATAVSVPPEFVSWLIISVNRDAEELPDGGALLRITTAADDSCPDAVCDGGCNGAGDSAQR